MDILKNRLGLNFKYEKYNTPNKISPYQEMLHNKSYSIFQKMFL